MINATLRKVGDKSANENAAKALNAAIDVNSEVTRVAEEVGDKDLKAALGVAEDSPSPAPENPATPTSTTVATRPQSHVSRFEAASNGGLSGEWGREHVKFPSMKIVQGSGPMSQNYKTGQLVFADEVLLKEPDPTSKPPFIPIMRFIPLKLDLKWRENVSKEQYAAGIRPRIFNTKAEVENVGGSTRWVGFGPTATRPDFQESVTCLLLLEQPEGSTHPAFAIDLNGKHYAPCVYYATGSGFTRFAKPIFNAQLSLQIATGEKDAQNRIVKRVYIPKRVWTWETNKVDVNGNIIFAPNVRMAEDSTPEVREFADSILADVKADHIEQDDGGE